MQSKVITTQSWLSLLGKKYVDGLFYKLDDEKYVDLFWEPAFNKSRLYLSAEIIIDWMSYFGTDAIRNYHRDMIKKYKTEIDYK